MLWVSRFQILISVLNSASSPLEGGRNGVKWKQMILLTRTTLPSFRVLIGWGAISVQRGVFSVACGTFRLSAGPHKGGDGRKCPLPQLRAGSRLTNSRNYSQHAFLQDPSTGKGLGDNSSASPSGRGATAVLPAPCSSVKWLIADLVTAGVLSSALVQWRREHCSFAHLPASGSQLLRVLPKNEI